MNVAIDSITEAAGAEADLKRTKRIRRSLAAIPTVDRLPPHSPEAEQGVLGCVLLLSDCMGECIGKLNGGTEVFYDLRHQTIYSALAEMHGKREAIDVITLQQRLKDKGLLEQVGGIAYLASLPDTVPSAANLSYYLDIVQEKFLLRKMIQTCTEVVGRVYDYEGEVDALLDEVQRDILRVGEARHPVAEAHPMGSLTAPESNDPNELLKHRYVCRGAGMELVGQSGQGKSSLVMQFAVCWSLDKQCFGIQPAGPLRVLMFNAENDDGDLYEMFDGVCKGLGLSVDDRRKAGERILFLHEDSSAGDNFLSRIVEPLVRKHRPDLIIIDPALAYIPGDTKDAEVVGNFLRRGLNPILHKYGCAALVVHHTTKAKADGPQSTHDFLYAGAGSIEFTNWARAVLVLETKGNGCYRLHAPKRGGRIGWVDADSQPVFDAFIRHTRQRGAICWHAIDETEIESVAKGGRSKGDVLAHVPIDGAILKTVLLDKANAAGIGRTKARALLDELLSDGTVHLWLTKRAGTNPEQRISRFPQTQSETFLRQSVQNAETSNK